MTTHGGGVGDGGASDVDGDGFGVIQYFEIPMNDNDDVKLLDEYDETETSVHDDIDNTSWSESTKNCLPWAPAGSYPSGPLEGWGA